MKLQLMISRTLAAGAALFLVLPIATHAEPLNLKNLQLSDSNQIAQRFSRRARQGEGMLQFLEQLDLTEEQSTQIKAIRQEYLSANDRDYRELKQAREEMRSLLSSDASSDRLRQQHQTIQSLSQTLGDNRFEAMLEIREILTPEQRQEVANMMSQHRGRRNFERGFK